MLQQVFLKHLLKTEKVEGMTKLYISITRVLMDSGEQISHEMGMDAICGYSPSISGGKQVLAHGDHNLLRLSVQDAELLQG